MMEASWPRVPLSELLQPINRTEAVDPDKLYRLLGVRLAGAGAFERERKHGRESSAAILNRVEAGDFIYSRLFAWQGAFDVIPPALSGAYVSGEFPLYSARSERLDLRFLRSWFRLPETLRAVERNCMGSTPGTRNRFKEEFFDALCVPLPPLLEQRRIVTRLDAVAERVQAQRRAAAAIGDELHATLASTFQRITADAPRARMGDVAPLVRREVAIDPDASYPELGIRSHGKGTFHKPALPGIEVGSKRLFRVERGDLVFNIVFAWEGAVAIATSSDHGRFGSHRFLTCVADPNRATAPFLRYALLTPEGLQRLGQASPGGAGRNRTLGLQALARLEVPLPSLDAQRWFDAVGERAGAARSRMTSAEADLAALLPSLLHRAFDGKPELAVPGAMAAE